jgi:hypothetical protein
LNLVGARYGRNLLPVDLKRASKAAATRDKRGISLDGTSSQARFVT